ncbi:MAG: S8 family serine peptidase [Thermoplasmata archaeon]
MNEKKMNILISVGIAAILVMSVLTIAMVGVSGETGTPTTEEDDSEVTIDEADENFNTENTPSQEEVKSNLEKLKGEFQKDIDDQKKLDIMPEEEMEMVSGGDAEPTGSENEIMTDNSTRNLHNVDPVHDMGYEGDDVKVSLMDTGFDMAHPDIAGRHAVFEYDETTMEPELEQFDGYPIAYDAVSMMDYVLSGDAEMANWYVNTSYETAAYENTSGVIVAEYDGVNYTMPDYIGDGDTVRFGDHPDEKLYAWYEERPALLLTKDGDGNWGNISTDLNNDKSFADEKIAQIDGSDPTSELLTHDVDGDGITDISGGMGYFVGETNETGENMPIPYTQNDNFRNTMNTMINLISGLPPGYIEWSTSNHPDDWPEVNETGVDAWDYMFGYDMDGDDKIDPGTAPYYNTPEPGDMVALMGDFNGFGSDGAHGTWTASAVAGQGVTGVPNTTYEPTPSGGDGLVQGLAPNAEIIPMGDFFTAPMSTGGALDTTYSSAIFSAEGYDGDVSTDADQAQIASSSFGKSEGYEGFGGYDFYERFFDYVGTNHTQNTLFVNSAGNEGTGFGSLGSPSGGEAILSVGGANNQYYRKFEGHDEGPNPWQGEVAQVGSRGPAKRGTQGVDVIANAEFGYGGDPVNQQIDKIGEFNGSTANELWSGTSLAAPNAAGVAALIYQAYWNEMGEKPSAQMVKEIIKQGADDINNSPFNQGSGVVDAGASVDIIQEGLYSSTSEWRPGMDPETGTFTEMNVNMMEPGDTYKDSLSLSNWGTDSTNYSMEATHLQEAASNNVTFENTGTGPYLMLNESGVYELEYNETNDDYEIGEMQTELDAPNADLFRFGAHNTNSDAYSLIEYFDWTDDNGTETYDGVEERNRIGYAYASLGGDYTDIYNPIDRLSDGMIIGMRDLGGASHEVTLNIQQFNEESFDWVSIDNSTGTIPAEDNIEYNLTASVPSDAAQGIYEGKVMITNDDTGSANVIPVTITVGERVEASDGNFDFQFGEGDGNDAYKEGNMYRNDRLYGSWDDIAGTGDWRVFNFRLENQTNGPVALNIDSDANVEGHLLTPTDSVYSLMDNTRYGNYTFEATDENTTDVIGNNTGLTTPGLDPGTYAVVVHGKDIPGDQAYENFTVEMFTPGNITDAPDPIEHEVSSYAEAENATSGTLNYNATAGFDADTVTNVSKPPVKTEQETWVDTVMQGQGDVSEEAFVEYGTIKGLEVASVSELDINMIAEEVEADDLDMALFLDDGDKELTMDDTMYTNSAVEGNDERMTVSDPEDGYYFISVLPYAADEGDEFSVEISKSIEVEGLSWEVNHPESFTAGEEVTFEVDYTLPNIAGTYSTWIGIGRENASRGFELQPQITLVDNHTGTFVLDEEASTTPVNSTQDKLIFEHETAMYTPLNHSMTEVTFDGEPIPDEAYNTNEFTDVVTIDAYKASVMMGYDGEQTFDVVVSSESEIGLQPESDPVTVTVDTLKLDVDDLPEWSDSRLVPVNGQATPGSHIMVNGEPVSLTSSGAFSTTLDLEDGTHDIEVVAMDSFQDDEGDYYNRTREVTQTVNVDTTDPYIRSTDYRIEDGEARIVATVEELFIDEVTIGGTQAEEVEQIDNETYVYTATLPLDQGDNTFTISVTDMVGQTDSQEIAIEYVSYGLTVDQEGEGTVNIDPEQDEYQEGTEVTLTAEPAEGWEFVEWTGTDETGEEITIMMDENKTITANFEQLTAELGVNNFNVDVDGPEVTVTADVENTGDIEGEIDLMMDGEVIDTVSVGAGDTEAYEYTYEFDEEGDYTIEFGDQSETVTVEDVGDGEEPEEEGIDMMMIAGIILIIVIILAIIGYMMMGGKEEEREEEYSEEEMIEEEYGEEEMFEEEGEEEMFEEEPSEEEELFEEPEESEEELFEEEESEEELFEEEESEEEL